MIAFMQTFPPFLPSTTNLEVPKESHSSRFHEAEKTWSGYRAWNMMNLRASIHSGGQEYQLIRRGKELKPSTIGISNVAASNRFQGLPNISVKFYLLTLATSFNVNKLFIKENTALHVVWRQVMFGVENISKSKHPKIWA